MIITIEVFDFDGSLCRSPLPSEASRKQWEKAHGRPWAHKGNGWWSKPESLCIKAFDPPLNDHVKEAALKAVADPSTYTVLLTGRLLSFAKTIKEIMRKNGVPYMDEYLFNDSLNTLAFKLEKLQMLKDKFPKATRFIMWEDRVEHIPHFEAWGKKNYGNNFILNVVESDLSI
jgi:hypothetical protein